VSAPADGVRRERRGITAIRERRLHARILVLLVGSVQVLFSGGVPGAADERGVAGVLGILDVGTGRVVHRWEYRPAGDLYGGPRKVQFTGFGFAGGRLWVCSFGEILGFDAWPPREPSARISLPGFNDLHHCLPWRDGLAVANTGLETVELVSFDGELRERWDLLAGMPGARRIDPTRDYRRVADTKPHYCHVNHLFDVDGVLWATQLRSANAAPVSAPGEPLAFATGMPHDGRWRGDRLLFTTTNGHLVLADPRRGEILRDVALAEITPGLEQLGWCRGVCEDPRDPSRVFVAFSSVRRSRWQEFGYWIRWRQPPVHGRVVLYDIEAGRLCASWDVGDGAGDVLFQLEPLPPERWV